MKRLALISMTVAACLSLAACGNSNDQAKQESEISSLKTANSKLKKKIQAKKKAAKSSSSSAASASSNQGQQVQTATSQQGGQQTTQQGGRQLTQGEINRMRGYDPNGNPLLPGQDHAAGSNPDGTPDAWVQGQIDWAKQNGYLNPDGSPTQKEIDLENQFSQENDY